MKRQNKSRIIEKIIWIPVIGMILFIFGMSLQNGDTSTASSEQVSITMAKYTLFGIDLSGFLSSKEELDVLNGMVRTMAHTFEFMVLSLFTGIAVTVCGIRGRLRFFYSIGIGLFIALCDEFIQIFVPGRYCDLSDILCDFAGTLVVALIVRVFSKTRLTEDNGNEKLKILGVTINNITFEEAVDRIIDMAVRNNRKYVLTPNVDHIVKLDRDKEFAKIYEDADLVTVDGTPIMWISKSCSYKIKQRVTGSDLFPAVCEKAAKHHKTLFILGAAEGVAKIAADNLKESYKGLRIVGTYSPKPGFEKDEKQVEDIIAIINKANPDILVLALGSPKQEKFLYNNREKMNFGVALPFGAAVDFVAGNVTRAPKIMRKMGLEWLFRFLQEPGRLFRRYFIDDVKIFWIAWKLRHDTGFDVIENEMNDK